MSAEETITRDAEQARVTGAKDEDRTPNDVAEDVAQQTYGDYLAAEVLWLEIDEEAGEIHFEVDIPGHGTYEVGPWTFTTWDEDEYFVRILLDHGLTKYEPEKLVGRRVLVMLEDDGSLDYVYNPPKAARKDLDGWHDEHVTSPYAEERTRQEQVAGAVGVAAVFLATTFFASTAIGAIEPLAGGAGALGILAVAGAMVLFAGK